MNKDLRIEIRPIPGRDGIRKFSEQLEFFSQAHILSPLVDPVTLKYVSGLSKKDVEYLEKEKFPYNLDETWVRDKSHEFWDSTILNVELTNSPAFLYPGKNLIDFVKYKFLLAHSFIYSSLEDVESGAKPQATHYIYDESQENKLKATKIQKKNNLLAKIRDLSPAESRKVIMILLNENTENKNEDYLTIRFNDILNSPAKSLELELLLENSTEHITLTADIKDAIYKNILTRNQKGIFYFDLNLGLNEEMVREFLQKEENQHVLVNIKEKLSN